MVTENTTPETALARFVHRLAAGDHADWAEGEDAEGRLRRAVLDEVLEPLLCDLLNTFEDRVIKPLRSLDDYALTDRRLDFVERLRSMSPSAQQVFGDLLVSLGLVSLKTGIIGEAQGGSLNGVAASVYSEDVRKYLSRANDLPETLHSGRSFTRALGEPLYAELMRAFALRDARTVGEL